MKRRGHGVAEGRREGGHLMGMGVRRKQVREGSVGSRFGFIEQESTKVTKGGLKRQDLRLV